ncbi:MAG: terpene cyclase/mutase family protein [Pirellulales bacterium]|nr:terpene cyclase/mutase family protein [Pirellulales bacterium]
MNPLHAENSPQFPETPLAAAEPVDLPACAMNLESVPVQTSPPTAERSPQQPKLSGRLLVWFDRCLVGSQTPSWLASGVLHAAVVLLLSLLAFSKPNETLVGSLEGVFEVEDSTTLDLDINQLNAAGGELALPRESAAALSATSETLRSTLVDPAEFGLPTEATHSTWSGPALESIGRPLASRGGGMNGRHPQNRRGLALAGGGTEASELAVELSLAWLAAHQFQDGGWRFDLESCPQCQGACRNSGFLQSTTASTGLALLCFLGAGYTQHEGPYQETVAKGLYYLVDKMLLTSLGGDLRDQSIISKKDDGILLIHKSGDMYSQAIATLALCEAYAMTRDENLAGPAQEAVKFIVDAQHEKGGWRYRPGEPGDTSVTGWQLTALKSAALARLEIPRNVWYRAAEFLDGVQDDRGATYGYQEPSKTRRSMSVVGLFSRMLLGWSRDHVPMLKGMARIADQVPHQNDMYFNYYATQALHHFGGAGWRRWNPRMRDYLVKSQATEGHERGSWYFQEAWSDRGGRLYTTTLSILTLEVYYRYMPMYQDPFVTDAP